MRQIDADALKDIMLRRYDLFSGCTNPPDKARRDEVMQVIADINSAPTVDAIPVEWIREKRDALKVMKPGSMSEKLLTKLLMVWHLEQCEKEAGL